MSLNCSKCSFIYFTIFFISIYFPSVFLCLSLYFYQSALIFPCCSLKSINFFSACSFSKVRTSTCSWYRARRCSFSSACCLRSSIDSFKAVSVFLFDILSCATSISDNYLTSLILNCFSYSFFSRAIFYFNISDCLLRTYEPRRSTSSSRLFFIRTVSKS
jgi:hypothetical protein